MRRTANGNGLYFARHRYYHAELKRWIARDPIGLVGGANLYAYGLNSPLIFIDAFGLYAASYWEDQPVLRQGSWSGSLSDNIRESALDIEQHNDWEYAQTQINPTYNPIYLPLSADQQAALNQPLPITNPEGGGVILPSTAATFYSGLGGGAGSQTIIYDSGEVVTYGFLEFGAGGGRAGLSIQGGTVEDAYNPEAYEGFFLQGAGSAYVGGTKAVSGPDGPSSSTLGYGSPGASLSLQYYFIIRSNRD